MKKIKVGLYGTNGHQIQALLQNHPEAELTAVAGWNQPMPGVKNYETLDALLADPEIELVSLCSPLRINQAQDALKSLRAGKPVYAEKPCALNEQDLDEIIATAKETGVHFHEMAGTVLEQPYREMRRLVQQGAIGTVVQVLAQKCYPWADWRPADEAIDGGLATQVGVYIARFVEHIACQKIASLQVTETRLGNPNPASQCRIAAGFHMTLENGGLASGICNYLNPIQARCWGYEIVRIFGTEGILESCAEGAHARLLLNGQEPRDLERAIPSEDYFDRFIALLKDGTPMPMTLEEELNPTRWVIRARNPMQS